LTTYSELLKWLNIAKKPEFYPSEWDFQATIEEYLSDSTLSKSYNQRL
jgi:hypothetical protein